jgi:hypothetical protein
MSVANLLIIADDFSSAADCAVALAHPGIVTKAGVLGT